MLLLPPIVVVVLAPAVVLAPLLVLLLAALVPLPVQSPLLMIIARYVPQLASFAALRVVVHCDPAVPSVLQQVWSAAQFVPPPRSDVPWLLLQPSATTPRPNAAIAPRTHAIFTSFICTYLSVGRPA